MNRYQLAKLVEWAGELRTRKRLQKIVYLLQAAGSPIEAEFTLHQYGPYSYEVAHLTDEMVRAGLLEETTSPNVTRGESYSYKLSDSARAQVRQLEQSNSEWLAQMHQIEPRARVLLNEKDLPKLEFAATIAYFRKNGESWKSAREAAARFKEQLPENPSMNSAEELARQILEPKVAD